MIDQAASRLNESRLDPHQTWAPPGDYGLYVAGRLHAFEQALGRHRAAKAAQASGEQGVISGPLDYDLDQMFA